MRKAEMRVLRRRWNRFRASGLDSPTRGLRRKENESSGSCNKAKDKRKEDQTIRVRSIGKSVLGVLTYT
jgi:hypothetical protein